MECAPYYTKNTRARNMLEFNLVGKFDLRNTLFVYTLSIELKLPDIVSVFNVNSSDIPETFK